MLIQIKTNIVNFVSVEFYFNYNLSYFINKSIIFKDKYVYSFSYSINKRDVIGNKFNNAFKL